MHCRLVRQRTLNLQRFDHLYDRRGELGDPCVYCGIPSSGWDHIPPLVHIERMREAGAEIEAIPRKVPACGECNVLLNDVLLTTIQARRYELKRRLRDKYRRIVSMPEWDEDELAELSNDDAREYIRQHLAAARYLKSRLGWAA